MRYRFHTWLGILVGTGLCLTAQAVRPGPTRDQFSGIPERNVFGLKEGPAEQEPPSKGPPPKLTLTGITTLLGNKLALLRAALPAAPGTPAQEKPLMLGEGQRDGNIEVLEINEKAGTVRVDDAGEITTLSFAKNGVKPGAPGTVASASGAQGTNALPSPYAPGMNTRMRVMPMRMPRSPVTGSTTTPSATGEAAPETSAVTPNTTTPGAVPATTPSANDLALTPTGRTNAVPQQNQLTPEQLALLEALQQAAAETNAAPAPPPPPSVYSPYPTIPQGANQQRQRPPFYPQ